MKTKNQKNMVIKMASMTTDMQQKNVILRFLPYFLMIRLNNIPKVFFLDNHWLQSIEKISENSVKNTLVTELRKENHQYKIIQNKWINK